MNAIKKENFINELKMLEAAGLAEIIDLHCFELAEYLCRDKLHNVMNDYIELQRKNGFKSLCLDEYSSNELTVITFFRKTNEKQYVQTISKG